MSLPLPSSLTPSKVSSFKDCGLAFRFSSVDRLPEPPSPWTTKGSVVHRALELLFWREPPGRRSVEVARTYLDLAWAEAAEEPEVAGLDLDAEGLRLLRDESAALVERYFELEDPDVVRAVGVELCLETRIGEMTLRGVIDRLDVDEDGEWVVTDYKTGRVPRLSQEQNRLSGVHFYAFLCQEVLGRRPSRVQLLYLQDPVAIVATPSEQSIRGLRQRSTAVWSAIERACRLEDFRPKPSALCGYCAYKEWCPAFGGDPARAAVDLTATAPVPV
jgi:putative RecB family exonuclease